MTSAAEAIDTIASAQAAHDLFDGSPADAADARRARRRYRVLITLTHPDLAAEHGITAQDAQAAAARLNDLYEQWQHQGHPQPTAPHVVGDHGTYMLQDKVAHDSDVATYITADASIRVDIARTPDAAGRVNALTTAVAGLHDADMSAFAPELVDHGRTAGHAWVAYRLPDGLSTLREVRAAYPQGLDGRDWAWMARRVLMALDAAGVPHGNLTEDTVLIHPEQHGVVLTGWRGAGSDGPAVASLFTRALDWHSPGASRQIGFANAHAHSHDFSAQRALCEYDLLLRLLYGERRYRPFTIPVAA